MILLYEYVFIDDESVVQFPLIYLIDFLLFEQND